MSDDEFAAIIGTVEQQLIHAQACLDLFEKDRGRRAYTTSEVRNWADCQEPENLRFRILRRVHADQGWNKACKRIWNDIPVPLTSRRPMGQRICLALAEAARALGLSEAAVLDAIEQGRIAAMKDMQGTWHVDRATLYRAFPSARVYTAKSDAAKSDSGKGRPLDAATLVLEVEMSTLVKQAGDRLRGRRLWWR
jgi:ribosomal protein L16/L10AE